MLAKTESDFSRQPEGQGFESIFGDSQKNAVKHPEQAARAVSAVLADLADLAASAERDFSLKELGRAAKTNLRSFD